MGSSCKTLDLYIFSMMGHFKMSFIFFHITRQKSSKNTHISIINEFYCLIYKVSKYIFKIQSTFKNLKRTFFLFKEIILENTNYFYDKNLS